MHTTSFEVKTHDRDDFVDITSQVAAAVREAGISDGMVTVYVPHTTAGVTINENADPSVVHDIIAALDTAVPWRQSFYRHGEGNSAAHVKSSLMGCTTCIPVREGSMTLGTWQGIYFCEFDGPRTRRVLVTVTGE
ncbi:MAG: secondary thiamine-phosphate synthase enzyme YjbQ [Phycisphaerae bacterium]